MNPNVPILLRLSAFCYDQAIQHVDDFETAERWSRYGEALSILANLLA